MRIWNTIALLGVLTLIAALAAAQPTPFVVSGWVNYTDGDPVNDPSVTVTNLNTDEVFIAETNASSNYFNRTFTGKFFWKPTFVRFLIQNRTLLGHGLSMPNISEWYARLAVML